MARRTSQADPILSIDFFTSGFYTYRSQLFAPFKGIGVNVVSFHDPVIDGLNFELTDKFEWTRRPGFSIFCPIPLADGEIVNDFYSSRNLNGDVVSFADTRQRLLSFSSTAINTIASKTTVAQGYIATVGNITYFADGAAADYVYWNTSRLATWGLAPPTVLPTTSGMGFWQPDTSFPLGSSILDNNGSIESVSSILIPNGAFESPAVEETRALGGSLTGSWMQDPLQHGVAFIDGFKHIQQKGVVSGALSTISFAMPSALTVGNTVTLSITLVTQNLTPGVLSVADNLGNTYSAQASGTGTYNGGGGNHFPYTIFLYSAPVTTGGVPTVTVSMNTAWFTVSVHEFQGIGATATVSNSNFIVHPGTTFNTGTVSYSGTKLVLSTLLFGSGPPVFATPPFGYTAGTETIGASGWVEDAFIGAASPQSPTWGLGVDPGDICIGLTVAFPITTLATGYTPYLFLHDFDFGLPSGATIVGIAVAVPKHNSGTGTVQDHSVRLVIGGVVVGTDQAHAVNWSNAGYLTDNYGGATDTWGLTPSAAQINTNGSAGFGFAISALVTSITGGSAIPEVGFFAPNQVAITIYFTLANGTSGPGISGANEPIWNTTLNGTVNDGGITWSNYGPIQTWFPVTGYQPPIVILDSNGFLQLATHVANPVAAWAIGDTYAFGAVVYFGGQYWVSVFNGSNTGVVPSVLYAATGSSTNAPYWALTTTPLVTGLIPPVWNTARGGMTADGSYTWTNIGQGTGLAFMGYSYVYAYRTIDGHLTTASPFSANTGAILGPLNSTIISWQITSDIVKFTGANNFIPGNVFEARNLMAGAFMNNEAFIVISAVNSESFPLTSVQVNGSNTLIILATNNLVAGEQVTFVGVGTATFLNGVTVTVSGTGLSASGFQAPFTHGSYGATADTGTVFLIGSYTAAITHADVGLQLDSGVGIPLIATVSGIGTGSGLCNATAAITAVRVIANIVRIAASNNFQPGIFVTITGLTSATFLNGQQVEVIAVDQPVGTTNTWFEVFFETPNYMNTVDAGTATFNAVEIYRTSDGGGTYLFSGAVTNPGVGAVWLYDDFVVDADLDIQLIAPLFHQNDPPPGAPGSSIQSVGSLLTYWQGRLWLVVGNFVYFDAGPDCTNGIPEQSWPPGARFQYAGPVLGLEPTADGVGMLVYLADRVAVILGGPETISFYSTDALSNFGIASTNTLFRDGSVIGQFTTQKQYIELIGGQKNDEGQHIGDYLAANFNSAKSYVAMHRDGLDVGVFIGNGTDRIVRYGSNVRSWSVPYFPSFGAGAMQSVETSVGVYSLMLATPAGGKTSALGPIDPSSGANIVVGSGPAWINPSNITLGSTSSYATATFVSAPATSQVLRASAYVSAVPTTAVIQGITVSILGKQSEILGDLEFTITPTNPAMGATSHTFTFGTSNTTVTFGSVTDTWGMPWRQPYLVNSGAISFDITVAYTGASTPVASIAEVEITITYQNPGNYLYARDLNSWGDAGEYGQNNGSPYATVNIVLGNITLSQPGARMVPLQTVVGYFDAAGTLNNGGPSVPDVWILPNEVAPTNAVNFIQLPEFTQEPPAGQNNPSTSLLALRWPVNMMNSNTASQFVHHLQVKIQFEPENAPNTIKAISFMEDQST